MVYPGGKGGPGVFQRLINFMPPHEVYIEPFLGGGAVFRSKRPAVLNIGLDLNPDVIAGWRAAVDGLRDGWRRRASPESAVEACSNATAGGERSRTAAAGSGNVVSGDGRRLLDGARVEFHCADAVEFLRTYRYRGAELVYCDPPYLLSTRGRRLYGDYEMSDAQHRALLSVVLRLPCAVMVSGYPSAMYGRRLAKWHMFTFQAMTRGGRPATENVWCNFTPPVELHDYSWLGENYRERERIGRMRRRWLARLARMPRLQRLALQSAIAYSRGLEVQNEWILPNYENARVSLDITRGKKR